MRTASPPLARPAGWTFDRGPDIILHRRTLRFASLLGVALASVGRVPVRPVNSLGNLDHGKVGSRLSLAGGRPDDDRRRAVDHDRHCRRIYRKNPFGAEGPARSTRSPDAAKIAEWDTSAASERSAADERHRAARSGCAPTISVLRPGVNRAIRDLIARGRLNATSVMVVGGDQP